MAAKDSKSRKVVGLSAAAKDKILMDRKKLEELMESKERSTAIVQPIGFEIMLASVIGLNFRQKKEVEKLMTGINMVQKVRLAYILELINKVVYNDLKQIHEIRNIFAHSLEASFADTKILKFIRKLSTAKGQEVTARNSYRFYKTAGVECIYHIMAVIDKQALQVTK